DFHVTGVQTCALPISALGRLFAASWFQQGGPAFPAREQAAKGRALEGLVPRATDSRRAEDWVEGMASCVGGAVRCSAPQESGRAGASLIQRFQLVYQPGYHAEADLPEGRIRGVEAERPQQFRMVLGAARFQHLEVFLLEA